MPRAIALNSPELIAPTPTSSWRARPGVAARPCRSRCLRTRPRGPARQSSRARSPRRAPRRTPGAAWRPSGGSALGAPPWRSAGLAARWGPGREWAPRRGPLPVARSAPPGRSRPGAGPGSPRCWPATDSPWRRPHRAIPLGPASGPARFPPSTASLLRPRARAPLPARSGRSSVNYGRHDRCAIPGRRRLVTGQEEIYPRA